MTAGLARKVALIPPRWPYEKMYEIIQIVCQPCCSTHIHCSALASSGTNTPAITKTQIG